MKNNNPLYPAIFTPVDEGGFEVNFRDVPEANTDGITFEDAVNRAEDSLVATLKAFEADNETMPKPSRALSGDVIIELKLETEEELSV